MDIHKFNSRSHAHLHKLSFLNGKVIGSKLLTGTSSWVRRGDTRHHESDVLKLTEAMDLSLLDEYNIYWANNKKEGAYVFILNDDQLYFCCVYDELENKLGMLESLMNHMENKELTGFDVMSSILM